MMSFSRTFEYPSNPESSEQMIDDLNDLLDIREISPQEKYSFLLAVSEAFSNAIIHGNQFNPKKSVKLTVLVNENELSADIEDEGHGGLKYIENRQPSEPFDEGGRGIDLIEHYATAVSYTESAAGGLKASIKVLRKNEVIE